MRLLRNFVVTGLFVALTSGALAQRNKLSVGDPAPGLDIEQWVKGEETGIATGEVYIVEFWATWCVPCRGSIPHLTELQETYGDRGLTIIGISTEEPEVVEPWVRAQGNRMGYTVAVDRRSSTDRAWRLAADIEGIPAAFLVDRQGKIAFIGNPHPKVDGMMLEQILEKVIRGRYDPALQAAAAPVLDAARTARSTRTWRIALKQYDEVIEMSPTVFAETAIERFEMMLVDMGDRKGAYDYAREKLFEGYFTDDEGALRMLAEKIATDARIAKDDRDLGLALEAAEAAVKLTGGEAPGARATLALVHYHRGELDKAIQNQKRAWMIAKPKYKAEYQRVLKSYQAAADRTAMK